MSKDPLEEQSTLNLYLYALNNSINYFDYLGLKDCGKFELAYLENYRDWQVASSHLRAYDRQLRKVQRYYPFYKQMVDGTRLFESFFEQMLNKDFQFSELADEILTENIKNSIRNLQKKIYDINEKMRMDYFAMNENMAKYNNCINPCDIKGHYCRYYSGIIGYHLDALSLGLTVSGVGAEMAIVTWALSLTNNAFTCSICTKDESQAAKATSILIALEMTAHLAKSPGWVGAGLNIVEFGIDAGSVVRVGDK